MANPYQSTKSPITHHDKATARELLVIIVVLAAAALGYGYYRKMHEAPYVPLPVATTNSTTSSMNDTGTNSSAVGD